MALTIRKGLLQFASPFTQAKRFRGKINVQKPKPPHFQKALYLELTKPFFPSKLKNASVEELCLQSNSPIFSKDVENPFQNIVAKELYNYIHTSKLVAFYHLNPMNADLRFKAYVMFKKQNMHLHHYGKKTMEIATKGTPYETILDFYVSHNMTLFSKEPDLKSLLKINKKFPQLILLAALYEGQLINRDDVEKYSAIPNLQTAQSGLVQTLNQVASNVVHQLNTHQSNLVANLEARVKQLEENRDE